MRTIKALLVLLFLAPTLAASEPNPESSFLHVQRDAGREPVALQTVIAKYVPASGAKGVEIDLVAVVHIGEKAYYERLNKEFEKYDTVLTSSWPRKASSPRRAESRRATTRSPCSSRA